MEKASLVSEYRCKGLRFDECLKIVNITRNQYYYNLKGVKPGKPPTKKTNWLNPKTGVEEEVDNAKVVEEICDLKSDNDQADYYKLICVALCLKGYFINHKKVYRLMRQHDLLQKKVSRPGKEFVKHRRVAPTKPLNIIEMDIKYIWIHESRKYAFVLTILDTFTRFVLC
ncbi:MAG: IS3 family transposase [Saprospiraceae bacterium]|nr:IS3 family transposase [Saprospiraceae bacterium]MBK8371318.1 IS3 family transposase [Saprospiraceae bacterium]MBK8819598.1 IS3 family transposase [Saprospiraceae bacterium]MBK9045100.1 IS3 family transposase [Saprospiraceae bacterium]